MIDLTPVVFERPEDFAAWQDYILARPASHCSDLAEWRLLFRELYGFEDHSFLCREGGRVTGALSLYHIRSPFLGNMLVTAPFFGHGGLHADDDAAGAALVERALEVARACRVDYLELRVRQAPLPGFQANAGFAEFDLELGTNAEETWTGRLAPNARQNVRKSREQPLEFRLGTDHGPCFDLLRRTLRAHGTPFHGERFFALLDRHLGDRVRYAEVWHRGRIVAGGVVLRHGDAILTPYIGSLEEFRSLRANYLQYWGIIEHAHSTGVRRFEMGRSPRGSTHARFKRKWGASELGIAYQYQVIDPGRGYRSVSQPSPVQRLATRVWRRLPLVFTTALGPRLFRYIP